MSRMVFSLERRVKHSVRKLRRQTRLRQCSALQTGVGLRSLFALLRHRGVPLSMTAGNQCVCVCIRTCVHARRETHCVTKMPLNSQCPKHQHRAN